MTAVIGVLNKSGVALAADSAVTISKGKGKKIYNSAYKIFTLSKFHPVGIMIYNSASFMGIPWEILIKEYRKKLNDNCFDNLLDYQNDFIQFLKSNLNLISRKKEDEVLFLLLDFIFEMIIKDVVDNNLKIIDNAKTQKQKIEIIRNNLEQAIDNFIVKLNKEEKLLDFDSLSFDNFKKNNKKIITQLIQKYFGNLNLSLISQEKLFKFVFLIIKTNNFVGNWTGLVFTGYGEKEIFPSCLPVKVGEVIDNRIRYVKDLQNIAEINDNTAAAIRPFAQRDVIDTILSGIDTDLEKVIYQSFHKFFNQFIKKIGTIIGKNDVDLSNKIQQIDVKQLIENYSQDILNVKKEMHINPLMSSITSLSKEDLAELSESLIYLTYLKRRMSFSEESVGGPIDVALITKGDGFVWIKRKHYFDINLNQDFIEKYLKF